MDERLHNWQVGQLSSNSAALDEVIEKRFSIPVPRTANPEAIPLAKEPPPVRQEVVLPQVPEKKSA